MKLALVGATGTIGGAVQTALRGAGHEVVTVGHTRGDHTVDLGDPESIVALYAHLGRVDGVLCTAGRAAFGPLTELDDDDFALSLDNKLMGQVNLIRHGVDVVAEGGSFTLTSGTLSVRPNPDSAAVAMAGGAVESFVRAAALDLEGRCRVNVVSPGWVAESRVEAGLDPMPGIWAADLARYYLRCVEGEMTGQVVEAEEPLGDDGD